MTDAKISPIDEAPREPSPKLERVHPASARVVELDVRDDLRSGREPFSRILSAVSELQGEVLHLRATFEPVPLFAVLAKRGFAHESRTHAADDWSAWFWRPEAHGVQRRVASGAEEHLASDGQPPVATADPSASDDDETLVWLDVRGLTPPEPLMRTLAALETLPPGHRLVQVNNRVPQFLFPMLVERGFACDVDESREDRVLVRIWRAPS